MNIKVLAIAPYVGLRDLLLEMVQEETTIRMDVEVADLEEALPLIQQAEERGYDIIISRGGTANLIRKHSSLPVVDIPVSGYDILRVLTLIRRTNSKVAIIGFPNICKAVAEVSSLLDFEIPIIQISDQTEVRGALRQAFGDKVQIVLGDAVTVRAAQEMGYHGILITSGKESVGDMFREVRRVYDVYRQGQEQTMFYRDILDQDTRAIIALDDRQRILFMNHTAGELLGSSGNTDAEALSGSSIQYSLPALYKLISGAEETDSSAKWSKQFLYLNEQQYKVSVSEGRKEGSFRYLVSLDSIENWRNERRFAAYIPPRLTTFNQMVGSSVMLNKTIAKAQKYALSDRNLWVSGDRGTGKSLFAQAIHSASKRHAQGFYMIPCEGMTEQETNLLLKGTAEELGLPETGFCGTIYLNNVDRLDRGAQDQWLQAIRRYPQIRFIASSSTSLTRLKGKADYNHELIAVLGELQLAVPPLKERIEDIDEIIRVMIANYNFQSGKQIVGFREAALDELLQYDWPGNLRELERAIHEMLVLTQGNHVEKKDAVTVIEQYKESMIADADNVSTTIDLRGTLEEIERRIITYVLQEEGMNQSKTCKRLGMNRTTFWRKMNKTFNNET